ncbi:hypothetical protein D3C72_1707250 [compost metagenome]
MIAVEEGGEGRAQSVDRCEPYKVRSRGLDEDQADTLPVSESEECFERIGRNCCCNRNAHSNAPHNIGNDGEADGGASSFPPRNLEFLGHDQQPCQRDDLRHWNTTRPLEHVQYAKHQPEAICHECRTLLGTRRQVHKDTENQPAAERIGNAARTTVLVEREIVAIAPRVNIDIDAIKRKGQQCQAGA